MVGSLGTTMEVTAHMTTLDIVAKWAKMPDHVMFFELICAIGKRVTCERGHAHARRGHELDQGREDWYQVPEPPAEGMRPCIGPRVSGTEQPSEEFDSSPRWFCSAFQLAPSGRYFGTFAARTLEIERLP